MRGNIAPIPKRIVLIGHSLGGFMVAYAAANDSQILGVAMISAFDTALPRLSGTSSEALVAEARQNSKNWDYLKFAQGLKGRAVLITEAN